MTPTNEPSVEEIETVVDASLESSKADEAEIEITKQALGDLKEYSKDPALGVDEETMMAFIGHKGPTQRKWKLNPMAHTKKVRDIIKANYTDLIKTINNQTSQVEVLENIDKLDEYAKNILVTSLDKIFNYDEAAEDPDIGPMQLKYLAQELGHFLVVTGGKGALKHSLMLQRLSQLKLLQS